VDRLVPVGVRLTEVVGPSRQGRRLGAPSEAPAGAQEVEDGVVPLGEALADLHLGRLLRVHLVPPEALAETHHRLRLHRGEKRIESDVTRRPHGEETYGRAGRGSSRAALEPRSPAARITRQRRSSRWTEPANAPTAPR